jgi:hypothetical protein
MAQFAGFGPRTDIPLVENRPTDSASGDFDGDGDIDIAVCFQTAVSTNFGRVGVLLDSSYTTQLSPKEVVVVDLDGDGDLDAASPNFPATPSRSSSTNRPLLAVPRPSLT